MSLCDYCNGSGEGLHDFELCSECKGSGVNNSKTERDLSMEQALLEDYYEFIEGR